VNEWDLIIIGGGPAGLTAALYGSRSGLTTLLLEGKTVGGLLSEVPFVENYPGFPEGISGLELATKMAEQTRNAGAIIREIETAETIERKSGMISIKTDRASYSSNALILATGASHKPLGVKGEEQLKGRGLSYCALCDGPFFKEKSVAVVGGGNSAASSALYLAGLARQVYLIHRRDEPRAEDAMIRTIKDRGVHILLNREVLEIKGEGKVQSIVILDKNTNTCSEMEMDGVFVEVGELPNSRLARNLGIKLDKEEFIIVDDHQATSVSGVFAAGDVTYFSVKQISTAVGQGAVAATEAFLYVRKPYYRRQ